MANSSKHLQHKILRFRYHCAKEYDLDGDKVDTDEFIYDSDISVEDKRSVSRFGKAVEKPKVIKRDARGGATSDQVPVDERGVERVDPTRATPRVSTLNRAVSLSDHGFSTPSDSNVRLIPDPSVDDRKIEEIPEVPIFLDGSPVAPSKYEAIFEAPKIH